MINFVPHGNGIYHKNDQSILKGKFIEGILNGVSEISYSNGNRYIGQVVDGVIDGQGIMYYQNEYTKYEGN